LAFKIRNFVCHEYKEEGQHQEKLPTPSTDRATKNKSRVNSREETTV
jgi:hypothetical protein